MDKRLEQFDTMAMNLFLSLTLHGALKEKFDPEEQVLKDWMDELVYSTVEHIFPIPAEA